MAEEVEDAGSLAEIVPLGAGEVQLWTARAEPAGELTERCRSVLSPAEFARVRRIRRELQQAEVAVARGLLRTLLGATLAQDPSSVVLRIGRHGKPWVPGVEFNVSHSHGLVAVALCRDNPVGVDVEWINPEIEALEIARGSFAPEEIAAVEEAQTGTGRVRVFYRCWTRKEAVGKALGAGLTLPLSSFHVLPARDGGETAVEVNAGAAHSTAYFVRDVEFGGGFAGALACGSPKQVLRRFTLAGEARTSASSM